MSHKKSMVLNFIWLFLGHAVSALFFFIGMAHTARVLGPDYFGVINFTEILFMFFLTLNNVGLAFLGTRDVARYKEGIVHYVQGIVSLRFILALGGLALLGIFLIFSRAPGYVKSCALLYGLALLPASLFLDWYFQGIEKMAQVAMALLVRSAAFMAGVLWLARVKSDITHVAAIYCFSWILSTLYLCILSRRHVGMLHFIWDPVFFRKILKSALPVGFSLLVGWIILYFDTALLYFWKGPAVAGQYTAACRPIILVVTAIQVYFNAILPTMSKATKISPKAITDILHWTARWGLALFLPVAILGSAFAVFLMTWVYGAAFQDSSAIFSVLIWWPVIVLFVMNFSRLMLCYEHEAAIGKASVLTALVNIALNLVLIPAYAALGAAWAKIGADIATWIFYAYLARKIFIFSLRDSCRPALIAAAFMIFFLILAPKGSRWGTALWACFFYSIVFLSVTLWMQKRSSENHLNEMG